MGAVIGVRGVVACQPGSDATPMHVAAGDASNPPTLSAPTTTAEASKTIADVPQAAQACISSVPVTSMPVASPPVDSVPPSRLQGGWGADAEDTDGSQPPMQRRYAEDRIELQMALDASASEHYGAHYGAAKTGGIAASPLVCTVVSSDSAHAVPIEDAPVEQHICIAFLSGEELRMPVPPLGHSNFRCLQRFVAEQRGVREQQVRLLQEGQDLVETDDIAPGSLIQCLFRPIIPRAPHHWYTPGRYTLGRQIGSGAYASVWEAEDTDNNQPVAIKRCKNIFDDLVDCKRVLRELAILQALNHDCIVQIHDAYRPPINDDLYEACVEMNEFYMVLELCDSDMKKLLRLDVRLGKEHIRLLMYNLLRGLKYLHSAGVYHRDIKPGNILVNQDCSVKIADFNLACVVGEPTDGIATRDLATLRPGSSGARRQMTRHVVTRWYRAPEVILEQNPYSEKIDLWSTGCIYAELLQMLHEGPDLADRGPLFPGRCCSPLSPHRRGGRPSCLAFKEQLEVIVELLGTPDEEFIAGMHNEQTRNFLRSHTPCEGDGLEGKFAFADLEDLDLVKAMIRFKSSERISAEAALEHVALAEFRSPALESVAPSRISLSFENERAVQHVEGLAKHLSERTWCPGAQVVASAGA